MFDCFRFETKLTFVFSFILYINFGNKLETETEIFSKKFKRIQRKLKKYPNQEPGMTHKVIFPEIFSRNLIARINQLVNSYDIDPITYL